MRAAGFLFLASALVLSTASAAYSNYTFALITDIHIGHSIEGEYTTQDLLEVRNLETIVAKINERKKTDPALSFVGVLGDLSDKGQDSQMKKVKEILDKLTIPFIPVMGNHDIYKMANKVREFPPTGDRRWGQVFGPAIQSFSAGNVLTYTGDKAIFNPTRNVTSYFQNWMMEKEGVLFLGLDWNSREEEKGTGHRAVPHGELNDFDGGTYRWLNEALSSLSSSTSTSSTPFTSVFLFQHHPMHCQPIVLTPIMCFSEKQLILLEEIIKQHEGKGRLPPRNGWSSLFVGHIHLWAEGHTFETDKKEFPHFLQYEVGANVLTPQVAYVKVADGKFAEYKH
eukprot:TRINITY_DN1325_c0_g3_i1.p1 TRINITY_DN1325_c0_g3~~TRINITY_DN1325_c0_g3_i1.p1  ORF type:complete len:353 (-),score=96.09 TRINITY_DN1325_c0_g3_i1:764-1780(-)